MKKTELGVYYFPNYHRDKDNEKKHGLGWNEWELVKNAKPRFEGHEQPKIPLWGYEDESLPEVMAKKIELAREHGIDAFIFDWYWYEDGAYLEEALNSGFLKAPNHDTLKFALMWANHDWTDIHPCTRAGEPTVLKNGCIDSGAFDAAMDHVIRDYFTKDNYWRIDGKVYFSIYMPSNLVKIFGSLEATRKALDNFRDKVRKAGLGEVHLNSVVWCRQILPGEEVVEDINWFLSELGFDSVTSYIWIHHYLPEQDITISYEAMMNRCIPMYEEFQKQYQLPYFPNVTVGWDPSPRTIASDQYEVKDYPFTPIIVENTPDLFREALKQAKEYVTKNDVKVLTINAWNEWTEGSYLEPDSKYKLAYLEMIKEVFKD